MKKYRIFKYTIPFIILLCVWVTSNFNWAGHRSGRIIQTDGTGYYAYLPAIFIYKDLNFRFFDDIASKNYHPNHAYDYRYFYNNTPVNKYYAGTSLAIMPFFLIAHGISLLSGSPADGYSYFYMVMISLAAIFYLGLGLVFLKKILLNMKGSGEKLVSFILILIVFGTNLFYYVVEEPSMSHVYSFGFITWFIWLSIRYFQQPGRRRVIIMAAVFAVIILIRPVNGLVILLLPFAAGGSQEFINGFRFIFRNYVWLITSLIVFLAIISIQPAIYKLQTGSFIIYSYGKEGFNFLSPHISDFLFSYRKGLFVYTPVFLVALAGGYYLYKENRMRFFSLAGFLVILIYILSSWWQWYYGGSYSQRVMIEYYAIPAILTGYFLFNAKPASLKRTYIIILAILLMVNIVQSEQYRVAHIHWSEMDKEKYWKVFLRVDKLIKRENPLDQE